ncbi:hypothetical protein A3B64_03575 [candidate division WWE3 bacterium RIFCSPLOWO2_01_FULL_37_24]|nr:MAG: hypothetical protein A3B64_03575 [candidate division WWE3 bacterium RIFCSPLOWO2_01_FULL_37_24]
MPETIRQQIVREEITRAHFWQATVFDSTSKDLLSGGEYMIASSKTALTLEGIFFCGTVHVVVIVLAPISTTVTTSVAVGWHMATPIL